MVKSGHTKKSLLTENNINISAWTGLIFSLLGLLFAVAVFQEMTWLTVVFSVLTVACAGGLIYRYRKALSTRTGAFGLYSTIVTVLTLVLLGIVNFVGFRYPQKLDLTRSKQNTLNEQTVKVVKGLSREIKAILYAKGGQQTARPLLDELKGLNPKFDVEYVDPDKEPARARQAGIKKYNTLQISVGERNTQVEEPTEEKVLNALMKLLKDHAPTLCAITGHGERSFGGQEADGMTVAKKALEDQSYLVKDISVLEGATTLKDCTAVAIVGAAKALFAPEVKLLREYLANGGRMVLSFDLDIRAGQFPSGVEELMKDWYVKPVLGIIIDPVSKLLGQDMSMPIIASYSKDNAISRDFQGNSFFPFTSPLEIVAGAPEGLTVQWLGQTTAKSLLINDLKQFATGKVAVDPSKTKAGPFNAAIAVEGKLKDSKAEKKTRLVVFGSSNFANNNFARCGLNLDFFANAGSWVLDDESVISVRKAEDAPSKLELSSRAAGTIGIFSMLILPLAIAMAGIILWILRRRQ